MNKNKPKLNSSGLPDLVSISDVAKAAGVCERTIRRRIHDGALRAHRFGPRVIRIERQSVLEMLTGGLNRPAGGGHATP